MGHDGNFEEHLDHLLNDFNYAINYLSSRLELTDQVYSYKKLEELYQKLEESVNKMNKLQKLIALKSLIHIHNDKDLLLAKHIKSEISDEKREIDYFEADLIYLSLNKYIRDDEYKILGYPSQYIDRLNERCQNIKPNVKSPRLLLSIS